jgi:uncharacterized coiled-coil protein SlyX
VRIVSRRVISVSILMLIATAGSVAQTANQDPTIANLQRQIQEMRSQMAKMQDRIAELETTKENSETNSSTDQILPQSQTPDAASLRSQLGDAKTSKEPTSFYYEGITLTPGGFLESTILVRTRNENADIANSYTTIPLNGSSNAHLSEFRGTVRNSELSLLIQGSTGSAKLKGYVETDFLGAAHPARVPGPCARVPRNVSASYSSFVFGLLSPIENASLLREGLARAEIDPAGAHGESGGTATGRRAASPLRTTGRLRPSPP